MAGSGSLGGSHRATISQDATALLPLQARFQQHMLGGADASEPIAGSPARRALGLAIYASACRRPPRAASSR